MTREDKLAAAARAARDMINAQPVPSDVASRCGDCGGPLVAGLTDDELHCFPCEDPFREPDDA
jgi:hypothetical protein